VLSILSRYRGHKNKSMTTTPLKQSSQRFLGGGGGTGYQVARRALPRSVITTPEMVTRALIYVSSEAVEDNLYDTTGHKNTAVGHTTNTHNTAVGE